MTCIPKTFNKRKLELELLVIVNNTTLSASAETHSATLCFYLGGGPLTKGLWLMRDVACSSFTSSLAVRWISQGL